MNSDNENNNSLINSSNDLPNNIDGQNEILKRILLDDANEDDKIVFNHEEEVEDFGSPIYWDKRYEEDHETCEWFIPWKDINEKIKQFFKGDELVLELGCGNSEMTPDMQKTTFKNVIAIDISSVVIHQMAEKYKENKNLIWLEMDCRNLKFKDESFDIVFDKGTFDAIILGSNQEQNVYYTIKEVWRVLKVGGYFIEITFTKPEHEEKLFKDSGVIWQVHDPIIIEDKETSKKNNYTYRYYIYVYKKVLVNQ